MVKRCSTCLMPSTAPGSCLDNSSQCAWCQTGFPNYRPEGESALCRELVTNRRPGSSVDCLVGVSGGKDSSFAALKLAVDYGMRVEAFTYTHAGLTSEAMENARRVCSTLKIPHHVLALPDNEHARSFSAFFRAWTRSQNNIAAALTCVACKHLHLQGTQMAARRGIPMVVWANCPLETPPFLPLQPRTSDHTYRFKRENVFVSAMKLCRSGLTSPGLAGAFASHARTSVLGCLAVTPTAPGLRALYPSVKHVFFYDYYPWDPTAIRTELATRTGWVRPDAPDDWHTDCHYNVFKEYMFQSMYGASYTDAFLSNQIRYGLLTRSQAWSALCKSKAFYASILYDTLDRVGCSDLRGRIDPECFSRGIEQQ
jgi:glutamine---fructose-6-phosphate transaminase (isomerizing)